MDLRNRPAAIADTRQRCLSRCYSLRQQTRMDHLPITSCDFFLLVHVADILDTRKYPPLVVVGFSGPCDLRRDAIVLVMMSLPLASIGQPSQPTLHYRNPAPAWTLKLAPTLALRFQWHSALMFSLALPRSCPTSRLAHVLCCQLCLWSPRGHGRIGLLGAVLLGRLYGCTAEDALLRVQVLFRDGPDNVLEWLHATCLTMASDSVGDARD